MVAIAPARECSATERLHETEARLRVALAASRMALWELDLISDVIHGSPELNKVLGFSEDATPTTADIRAHYASGERERIQAFGAEALARCETSIECEFRYCGPDRIERWLVLRTEVLKDEQGQLCKAVGVVFDISERKRSEDELIRTKRRLDAVLANTSMSIFLMDEHQKCTFANAAAEQMSGYSAAELVGRTLHEVVHHKYPDGRNYPIEACPIDRAFPERSRMQGEELFVHRDGRFYPVSFTASPVNDATGLPIGTVVEARDISLEQERDSALRESEERFRHMADSAPIMLWVGDACGKCVYLNSALREFWGVALEDVSGFNWTPTVHPEDKVQLAAPFQEGMAKAQPFSAQARYRRSDGKYRILSTNASPRFGPRGEFLGMIGVNVDVTEIQEAHNDLVREKHHLEIINETGAAVASERDHDKIIQMVTDAAVALTGAQFGAFFYNVIESTGESFMLYALSGVPRSAFEKFAMPRATAVFHPTFIGEGVVRSDDILKDVRYGKSEPHFGMPSGHLAVRSYLAVPVVSRSGEVIGGIFLGHERPHVFKEEHEHLLTGIAGHSATAIDNARLFDAAEKEISDRKCAEAQLQKLNATLEERVAEEVAERTKAEEVLRQVQKMEAVGQLTGGIAHDFNNLLAVVIGGLNLLQRKLSKGETNVQQYIDGALDGANRAAALTQRLLAFSRRQPLRPELVQPNELIGGMIEILQRTIGEQISIETGLLPDLGATRADKVQLESSILNLAVNARDAMADGGKLIIETTNAEIDQRTADQFEIEPGSYVMLSVTDTGSGMSKDVLEKAFDPFFTTKDVGKGTGLGLSQVFGFVRQSGGYARIYSEVGIGTTIKLYLPRHWSSDAPVEAAIKPIPRRQSANQEVILVVEDDERVRQYAIEALSELGYSVKAAASGTEALVLLESEAEPDLLFTDVVMPEMTGKELADRAAKMFPGLRVLFTTGYTRDAILSTGADEPAIRLLQKPYSLDQLDEKIRDALEARPACPPDVAQSNGVKR